MILKFVKPLRILLAMILGSAFNLKSVLKNTDIWQNLVNIFKNMKIHL